jgi:SpoVK/Ycf46/Vps4 family AAA+-type ATPase
MGKRKSQNKINYETTDDDVNSNKQNESNDSNESNESNQSNESDESNESNESGPHDNPKKKAKYLQLNKPLPTPRDEQIVNFNVEIKSIDDLIYLGEQYEEGKKYNINVKKLNDLIPTLKKLQKVIGMDNVKKSITNQIIYFIQDFQEKNSDMLHTVIQGPPGVGKTMLGQIIGEIYYYLDIIEEADSDKKNKSVQINNPYLCNDAFCDHDTDDCPDYYYENYYSKKNNKQITKKKKELKFIIAKRSDLIGKYLGHTAAKTQEVIDKALGGVLFIDEAYSLGNPEGRDSFSKECIDTINQNLTEKKNKLLVIIAGYKDSLDSCFFAYNDGLRRRFPFVYTINKYSSEELGEILKKMVREMGDGWTFNSEVNKDFLNKFFEKNNKMFPNSAGDIETLVFNIKIEHSKRVFCAPIGSDEKKKINKTDIENALSNYKINMEKKEHKLPEHLYGLYV